MTETLKLICKLLQDELALATGRVYIYNQKIEPIKDDGLYVCVQLLGEKTFGSNSAYSYDGTKYWEKKSINTSEAIQIDLISRSSAARDRRFEAYAALEGYRANEVCMVNGMQLQILPNMVDLSNGEGASIPYRYNITLRAMRVWSITKEVPYYDQFPGPDLLVNA